MSPRLSASRDGASKKTSVAGTAFSSAKPRPPAPSASAAGSRRTGRHPSPARPRPAPPDGRGSRQARHEVTGRDRLAHQLVAGIGDQRRAGIADDGHRLSRRQLGQHARPLALGVVLVIGAGRARNGEMGEQRAAVARVLAVDHIGAGQHGERPQGDVGEVADRRRHHIEAGRQRPRDQLAQDLAGAVGHACRRASRPSLLRHACTSPPIRVFATVMGPGPADAPAKIPCALARLPWPCRYLRGTYSLDAGGDTARSGVDGAQGDGTVFAAGDRRPGERAPVRIAACGLLDRRRA